MLKIRNAIATYNFALLDNKMLKKEGKQINRQIKSKK